MDRLIVGGIDITAIAIDNQIKDADEFLDMVEGVCMEHGMTTRAPNLSDDPIPDMLKMAIELRALCQVEQERGRLIDAAQAYHDKSFITAPEYVSDLLDNLVQLLRSVPTNKGCRPRDITEFLRVTKILEYWRKAERTESKKRTLNAKFYDKTLWPLGIKTKFDSFGEADSAGAKFLCDIVECVMTKTRTYNKDSTAIIPPDTDNSGDVARYNKAKEVRSGLITQIGQYLKERRAISTSE